VRKINPYHVRQIARAATSRRPDFLIARVPWHVSSEDVDAIIESLTKFTTEWLVIRADVPALTITTPHCERCGRVA
jgi:hypothetical protein